MPWGWVVRRHLWGHFSCCIHPTSCHIGSTQWLHDGVWVLSSWPWPSPLPDTQRFTQRNQLLCYFFLILLWVFPFWHLFICTGLTGTRQTFQCIILSKIFSSQYLRRNSLWSFPSDPCVFWDSGWALISGETNNFLVGGGWPLLWTLPVTCSSASTPWPPSKGTQQEGIFVSLLDLI